MSRFLFSFIFCRFSEQNRTTAKIADTYEGVYKHLLQLGSFYTLSLDQDNFYLYDRLHSFFMEYYGNPYPLREIIANVMLLQYDF